MTKKTIRPAQELLPLSGSFSCLNPSLRCAGVDGSCWSSSWLRGVSEQQIQCRCDQQLRPARPVIFHCQQQYRQDQKILGVQSAQQHSDAPARKTAGRGTSHRTRPRSGPRRRSWVMLRANPLRPLRGFSQFSMRLHLCRRTGILLPARFRRKIPLRLLRICSTLCMPAVAPVPVGQIPAIHDFHGRR